MYIVLEIQKLSDGNVATLVTTHPTENEAESKFHDVLRYAAISDLPIHGAVMLSEGGYPIKHERYRHDTEE